MEFEQWLASDHRLTWIQLMQDRILSSGIPTDGVAICRYSAQLALLQEMKTWVLAKEEKPKEVQQTRMKAGMFTRTN